jgi:hypothetical protein
MAPDDPWRAPVQLTPDAWRDNLLLPQGISRHSSLSGQSICPLKPGQPGEAASGLLLLAVIAVAGYLSACRAAVVDPLRTLRRE